MRDTRRRKDVLMGELALRHPRIKEKALEGEPQKFTAAVRTRLEVRDEFLTNTGNINWRAVAEALPGVHYETLRKAVAGDRNPTPALMEQVAGLLGIEPDIFAEYQLHLAQRQFDVGEVGWEAAMDNLRRWASGADES
jgi:hypothetical protein